MNTNLEARNTIDLLVSIFPSRTTDALEIESLLRDLKAFGVTTVQKLNDLLRKHHSSILKWESDSMSEAHRRLVLTGLVDASKLSKGHTSSGLARAALRLEYGEQWEAYRNRNSEVASSGGTHSKYVFAKPPTKCPHNQSVLFKYRTVDSLLRILRSGKISWSSPLNFNDPFDVQISQTIPCTEELTNAVLQAFHALLASDAQPEGDLNNLTFFALRLAWQKRKKEGGPAPSFEEIREKFSSIVSQMVHDLYRGIDKNQRLWTDVVRSIRVLCLADDPFIESLWAHYSQDYSGAVLGLRCDPQTPGLLWSARRVQYSAANPVIATKDEWAVSVHSAPLFRCT